ncbi:MAG TPA: acyl-CoA thioesterase [Hyphomicrobiaceae bacterium]|nr:acyl-CoA thioesterase [Hyphomicrobiaceae bacterium]
MVNNVIEIEVDWADCDAAGIVFYPQFFRMMNRGTHKLFDAAGLPFHELTKRYGTIGVPLLEVEASFRSPARFGDRLELESRAVEWRQKTFRVAHIMRHGARIVFEARELRVWATLDAAAPNGLKALPIPSAVKARFGA